jgi:rhamnulokinase
MDLGAESCRVSLLRWVEGRPQIELVHRFPNLAVQTNDGLCWDLNRILSGLDHGLKLCAQIAIEGIRSIAVDGWAVDYVRLDAHGEPVRNPFCYRDERTLAAEESLHHRITAERMREITGIQIMRINTVYQMFADAPELRVLLWLNLPEYVLYRYGGDAVAERTNATHTQMVGTDGTWSREIFGAVDSRLGNAPPIVSPGTYLGKLRGPLTELPALANTRLIAPACHDTASAIAAIPYSGEDWAYISSGTWSLVGTLLKAPINTAEARAENFTNLGGADDTICFHKNVNGMWLLRQCMEQWAESGWSQSLPELIVAAAEVASPKYVLDVDDAELLLQGDMPERINAQLRRRGLAEIGAGPEDAARMASLLFHSLAARYADVLRKVEAITGKKLQRLYIMGGGSQNTLLNRLTAEATGLEVHLAGTECSTVGNFAVQLAALERGSVTMPLGRATCAWAAQLSRSQSAVGCKA